MTRHAVALCAAFALLAGCAWTPLPRPDPPPAEDIRLPELVPAHQAIRDACGPVQPDGSVTCRASDLNAADHKAVDLYHDGRKTAAVAKSERRHRQIDGEACQTALDSRDSAMKVGRWEFWRGLVWGFVGAAVTAGAAWGGYEISRASR